MPSRPGVDDARTTQTPEDPTQELEAHPEMGGDGLGGHVVTLVEGEQQHGLDGVRSRASCPRA